MVLAGFGSGDNGLESRGRRQDMDNESTEQSKEHCKRIFNRDQAMLKDGVAALLKMGLPTPGMEMMLVHRDGNPVAVMEGRNPKSVWDSILAGAESRIIPLGGEFFIRAVVNDASRKMSDEEIVLEWKRLGAADGIRWRTSRMTTCSLIMAGMDYDTARSLEL